MGDSSDEGTIIFASVGRTHYAFDVFSLDRHSRVETRLTDGESVNYNAQFTNSGGVVFVSERQGKCGIFLSRDGSITELGGDPFLYADRPSIAGDKLIFASTGGFCKKWADDSSRRPVTGIFSTLLATGETRRLTPDGVADYSPAVSPSGEWIAVASNLGRAWGGEIHELDTAICIFRCSDGSGRRVVADHGGWPCWSDDSTIFFHRRAPEDDWWSIYRVRIDKASGHVDNSDKDVEAQADRMTPPGVHAFTPSASVSGDWLAVATRRRDSKFRHVEIFDLGKREFFPLTSELHPELHHFNPFVSRQGSELIGYHRSRKPEVGSSEKVPLLHHVVSPLDDVGNTLLRIDGAFPSISPDGSLIAYNTDFEDDGSGVFIANLNGSGRRRIFKGLAFGTAWDCKRPGVVYTSVGHIFMPESSTVHIVALTFDLDGFHAGSDSLLETTSVKVLTKDGTKNNAFPSVSPDGKSIVFRSGRSGHKNLFIMDAEGEQGGIEQLTNGSWVDTMASWSPDGEWIAFSSTRDDPSGTSFSLYMVHPDGSELHRVLPRGDADGKPLKGRFNHVCFSRDSKTLLFTADEAGISAEPVSVPNQFQPYGELFTCNLDGSGLLRLTYNAYEDGTPCWGPVRMDPASLSHEGVVLEAKFQDCLWLDTVTEKMKQYAA